MTIHKGACVHFIVDVNGKKKPNTSGRDKHGFLYCPVSATNYKTEQIIPYLPKSITTREDALARCKSEPSTCTGLLMMDNWEFKKDYPWNI